GLVERFDSTFGTATVLMPLGGRYQATPATGMVAKLPVLGGDTTTATAMSFGYHPQLAKWSPFHGGMYAVVMAVANLVALGGDYRQVRLTLQEYFEKLGQESTRWGKPFSALLGAFFAQKQFQVAAIGGKDSMSGTFMDLHVPPTLVAFAVAVVDSARVISPEFKQAGSQVVLVPAGRDAAELPDFAGLTRNFARVTALIKDGKVLAAQTVQAGGLGAALSKMCFGNRLGVEVTSGEGIDWFSPDFGSLVLEVPAGLDLAALFGEAAYRLLGHTRETPVIAVPGMELPVTEAQAAWEQPLEKIFPTRMAVPDAPPVKVAFTGRNSRRPVVKIARPRVLLPVFPGTNCEYDTSRAFTEAGGLVDTLVIRNLTAADVEESISELVRRIKQAQIIMLPGGFSAGDEPDGSGKFIAAMFRNPYVKEAVSAFLQQRDGLMLGICNGFQALIKLGLIPYGEIREITPEYPTLTFNQIGRHVSCLVRTKVVSTLSPWFSNVEPGMVHTIAVSHGEGRFVASDAVIARLVENGQIATQYVDAHNEPTYDARCNPIGSLHAVEGVTSPDGRILGKMGHSERSGRYVAVNVPGNKEQPVFAAGINYFR
ncbi:MAG: phosphoribosylformylglycinamidine synthase subunit PurQ, partial [Heliobacteriaceae bacterium]|nr:phosphoribosylformylglycinamidine synthase subunit PurQ [Heliobacteriaceae bacterium]